MIAKRSPKGGFSIIERSLKTLTAVIAEDDSRTNEDKGESTDNCIAALGKHVLYQFDGALINI